MMTQVVNFIIDDDLEHIIGKGKYRGGSIPREGEKIILDEGIFVVADVYHDMEDKEVSLILSLVEEE